MSIRSIVTLALFSLALSMSGTALADTAMGKTYQIEIILFSSLSQKNMQSEAWPTLLVKAPADKAENNTTAPTVTPTTGSDTATPEPADLSLIPIPNTQWQLVSQDKKLSSSGQYHVLEHLAWRASFTPGEQKKFSLSALDAPSAWMNIGVQGYLTVKLDRYFHSYIHANFDVPYHVLAMYGYKADKNIPDHKLFELVQNRRMKSKELNLFDSPLFSALVIITPFQAQTAANSA